MVSTKCAVGGPCASAPLMLYKTLSAAVYGIDASIIEVEVEVSGIKTHEDHFHTVGLPDAAVRESRDRVRAALKNCGYDIPSTHITSIWPLPTSKKRPSACLLSCLLFSFEEALETTKIHGVAGVLDAGAGLVGVRPFRSPHHTISDAGLIGGGAVPRPGEVPRNVLEVMRQPLEDGTVCIARASMSLTFPARFMLAAAMNPCPCGLRFHCKNLQPHFSASKLLKRKGIGVLVILRRRTMSGDQIPRRIRIDLMTPEELAIRETVLKVEMMGCDVRLSTGRWIARSGHRWK
jgi:hypothetical protein